MNRKWHVAPNSHGGPPLICSTDPENKFVGGGVGGQSPAVSEGIKKKKFFFIPSHEKIMYVCMCMYGAIRLSIGRE
jgi:hypothetical protein